MRSLFWSVATTAILLAACSDSTGPSRASLIGQYEASSFTTTRDTVTVDQLDEGGYVVLHLRADKAIVAATIVPPDAIDEDGEETKLVGTWRIDGDRVKLVSDDATFLKAFAFRAVDSTLVGEASFGETRVRLVLSPRVEK